MKIIKRNGSLEDFDRGKIEKAILGAMEDLGSDYINEGVAKRISREVEREFVDKEVRKTLIAHYDNPNLLLHYKIPIKDIEDRVEEKLMGSHCKDVARQYIRYRYNKKQQRDKYESIKMAVKKIIKAESVNNSNANVDEYSFGGKKFEGAGLLFKDIALSDFISSDVAKAHNGNRIYIHDLDNWATGMHNCSFVDLQKLLKEGFATRNGDVRPANSISTAMQLVAVIFQCQSQVQFGGVASAHIDFDLAPYVKKSFKKHFQDGLEFVENDKGISIADIDMNNQALKNEYPKTFHYAYKMTKRECQQAAQGLYHNLNTLESRPGSQVPFTSINFGRDTSPEGRMISKSLLEASIDGIGKYHKTSIFPITIFQHKKGINAYPGEPNYDLKQLALKSLSQRIYPNFVNCDFSENIEDNDNPDTYNATMGCVDGAEIITYKYNNIMYVESFQRMWFRFSQLFHVNTQPNGKDKYIDLKDAVIYDTKNGFVPCLRLIRNFSSDWLDINFSDGRRILCTSDHPFETENKGLVLAKDLQENDSILASYNHVFVNESKPNLSQAWFLGFMLCDGYYQSHSVSASIAAIGEDDISDNWCRIVRENYKSEPCKKLMERGKKGTYYQLSIKSNGESNINKLTQHLTEMFGGINKKDRHVPNIVFSWSEEARISFLAGMIDADGYINATTHGGSIIQIDSTNKELSLQQMALIQSLGMKAKMYHNHYSLQNSNKIRYRIEFTPTTAIVDAIVCEKKKSSFIRRNLQDFDHVKEIKVVDKIPVIKEDYSYDVTTASEHFEVSGIYSHNCRTAMSFDRHGFGYSKVGRGNVSPVTINLPKIGIRHGICLREREKADLDGFWRELDEILKLTEKALVERYAYICSQNPKAAPFMYINHTMRGFNNKNISSVMKHGSQAIGLIGVAEMCEALFGKNHVDMSARNFALQVIQHISDFAKEASERNDLNFGVYFTPAEGCCYTICKKLKDEFGIISNITDKEFLTNSIHVPVWEEVTPFEKIDIEAPFCKLGTSGCITYVEFDSKIINNLDAVETVINYAMDNNIPYFAINFPLDTCCDCHYQGDIPSEGCPVCNSKNIERLARVTGYLTSDVSHFNQGKQDEVKRRFKHMK